MVTLPGIPREAIAYVQGAAVAAMRSQVHIVRPNVPLYSPSTGYAVGSTKELGYTGPAQVHPATGGGEQDLDGGLVEVNSVVVSIPMTATPVPMIEDHLVIDSSDDPSLDGVALRIIGISNGGAVPIVRTLTCTFVQGNPWNPSA